MSTLKELRIENGKTCAEVAAAFGVTQRTVSRYEDGTRSINISQVLTLAELYGVSAEEANRILKQLLQEILEQ